MLWDLGGGANPRPGRFIVDIDHPERVNLVWDLREPFPDQYRGIADGASFFHGPEHYSRYEIESVLRNINYVLASAAELEIRCPDMDIWAQLWLLQGANPDTLGCIFGSHENPWQMHKSGLNFEYLRQLLEHTGFVGVKRVSAPGQAELYPDDWGNPNSTVDKNKRLDLHVVCRKSS